REFPGGPSPAARGPVAILAPVPRPAARRRRSSRGSRRVAGWRRGGHGSLLRLRLRGWNRPLAFSRCVVRRCQLRGSPDGGISPPPYLTVVSYWPNVVVYR